MMTQDEIAGVNDLNAVDKEILRLKYTNRALTLTQIGNLLPTPISKVAVHYRTKKPKFKQIWDRLEQDVIWQLKEAQNKAITVILKTLHSKDEKLAFQAARTLIQPILENCPQLLPEIMGNEILEWDISDAEPPEA